MCYSAEQFHWIMKHRWTLHIVQILCVLFSMRSLAQFAQLLCNCVWHRFYFDILYEIKAVIKNYNHQFFNGKNVSLDRDKVKNFTEYKTIITI